VSHDHTVSDFNEYFSGMQWAAIPFAAEDKRDGLTEAHGVEGLPQALVLRVADGSVVLKDCRDLLNQKKKLAGIFE
jgi:hypothetical protein